MTVLNSHYIQSRLWQILNQLLNVQEKFLDKQMSTDLEKANIEMLKRLAFLSLINEYFLYNNTKIAIPNISITDRLFEKYNPVNETKNPMISKYEILWFLKYLNKIRRITIPKNSPADSALG